uniref:Uncharacterized protein n=1 Tax=Amphimedon queenslandica TaxID=400682 RepID=A0A1X7SZ99_AMPQE
MYQLVSSDVELMHLIRYDILSLWMCDKLFVC